MKLQNLFKKFRYPKLTILFISIILAYYLFFNLPQDLNLLIKTNSYLSSLIGGILFSFGFTAPFGVGILLTSSPDNIFFAATIGGFGAMLSDIFIFKLIKISFMNEFELIKKSATFQRLNKIIKKEISYKIRIYALYAISGIIISSPLPDELGVILLSGLTHIQLNKLVLISFIFNTIGILVILLL